MVHVLLLILKIIGCLLLLILFLLLFLLLIVLLVPVRYRFAGEKLEGKMPEGQVDVSWLFRLISFTGSYGDQGLRYRLRAAWINLMDSDEEDDGEKSDQDPDFPDDFLEEETESPDKEPAEEVPAPVEEPEEIKPAEEPAEEAPAPVEEPEETKPAEKPAEEAPASVEEPAEGLPEAESAGKAGEKKENPREPLLDRLSDKLHQIQEWLGEKMDDLDRKKQKGEELLETFPPEKYYPIVRDTVCRVIRHVIPQSLEGRLHFGFEDAYTTGRVCTWTACFYPIYAGTLELTPDFNQKVLEGELQGKGRIRLGYFVRLLIGLLLKKEVRFVICYLLKLRKKTRQSSKRPVTARTASINPPLKEGNNG